jgi:beta-galactosidase
MMKKRHSRRTFLQTTAGTAVASWGGMRIFAGSPAMPAGQSTPRQVRVQDEFVYGTHFYRPSNPPRSERRTMLQAIAQQYRFNTIRIYTPWVYNNPEPDKFDFAELEEVMRYCDEFGLRVLMGVVIEEAPYWLEQLHPETRFVDAKGQAERLSDSGNNVSGGWPGLCLDWEPVQAAAAKFIREMVKVVAPHSSMYAYDVWNEPHIEPAWPRNIWANPQELLFCYCPKTIADFQVWLQQRYGTLDRLNEAWTRRYPNWKAIDPPRHMGTYADWIDWRGFIIDLSTKVMKFRVEHVRAVDSRHLIESHAAQHAPIDPMAVSGINGWRLAEEVETWGLSMFPRWGQFPIHLGASKIEVTRSYAAGKNFWMTELQGGHGSSGLKQGPHMRARDVRLYNWLAVACGAKGIIYWTYHSEATGTEATGFGLVARDGSPTERVREAAEDNRLIQEHWDIIKDHTPKTEVAILFDQDNALLTYAMAGEEDASTLSFRGYYKALWNMDFLVDFIEPASLEPGKYKIVIVPWHLIGKKKTCAQLQRFAESGGTLILETSFGLFDEHCIYNPVVPPYGLSQAFGYREKENYYLPAPESSRTVEWWAQQRQAAEMPASEHIYYEPGIEFTEPIALRIKGHTFLTPIEVSSATPIAKSFGFTVAARKAAGSGAVYYIGTSLGASISAYGDEGVELLRALLSPVVRPAVTADKLRPRLVQGSQRRLLTVFNDNPVDQADRIMLPPGFERATDLYSRQEQTVQNNAIWVTVPFQDVKVFLLE